VNSGMEHKANKHAREGAGNAAVPAPLTLNEYRTQVGQVFGTSDWIVIEQAMIDQFADVTRDWQFIHTDPARAEATPFGGTIAHGMLTLSLISAMSFTAVPAIEGARMGVNYGFNSVRFIRPVRAGSRVRGQFTLKQFVERQPRQWQSTLEVSVAVDGSPKPALVAEWLNLATF
jgi:acyl dehydratase